MITDNTMHEISADTRFENQVLDLDGQPITTEAVPDLSDSTFREMYRQMRFIRRFDERGVSLQRQGRMGTFSATTGHEGALIGSEAALEASDWIIPYYRDHAATIAHGLPPENILQYYMGHEAGNRVPDDVNVFPISITIGGHLPHATGAAMASKFKGEEQAILCYFGDGATSEGDFHEAMNFAGVFDAPVVFFCLNNQWAISTPVEEQTRSKTIAVKANAYGFDGIRVDGTDPLAVYKATREAVKAAKHGNNEGRRPTLIEAVLYRVAAHNTTDDPSNYQTSSKIESWRARDPIDRFETFLRETGRLDDEMISSIEETIEREIADAIDVAESTEAVPEDLFEYAHAEASPEMRDQQAVVAELRDRLGDKAFLRE